MPDTLDQTIIGDSILVGPDEAQTWDTIKKWGGAGTPIHIHRKGFVVDFAVKDNQVFASVRRKNLEG